MNGYAYKMEVSSIRRCGVDCAIVPLKIQAGRKIPPTIRRLPLQSAVARNDKLYVIGHPNGLPLKIADHAVVNSDVAESTFQATLDTFHGNSGSPVFNATTHHVVGILTGGAPDFKLLRIEGLLKPYCWGLAHAAPEDTGETVTRVTQLPTK